MTPVQIKKLRARLRMTQLEFATSLGINSLTVSRWERGATIPPPPMIKLLEMVAAQKSAKRGKR